MMVLLSFFIKSLTIILGFWNIKSERMRILLLTILILLSSQNVFSNSNDLILYYFSGKVEVKSSASNWKLVTNYGLKIHSTDQLRLEHNAKAHIVSSKGSQLTLSEHKVFDVSDLYISIELQEQKGIVSAYAKFVWEEFNSHHEEEIGPVKGMRSKGTVSRGQQLMVFPFKDCIFFYDEILLTWKNLSEEYTLEIFSDIELTDLIFKKILSDTSIIINATTKLFEKGSVYYWKVSSSNNNPYDALHFSIIHDSKLNEIKKVIEEIDQLETDDQVQKLVLKAIFYESNKLFYEAYKIYNEAVLKTGVTKEITNLFNKFMTSY